MRLPLLLLLTSSCWALAEDAKVAKLSKQLAAAKDPKAKVRVVEQLQQNGSPEVVPALCAQLKDPAPAVRVAVVKALSAIYQAPALECLKAHTGETNADVKQALEAALAPPGAGLYVAVWPVLGPYGAAAEKSLRKKISALGATLAPPQEERLDAVRAIAAKHLTGYELRLEIGEVDAEGAVKVDLLVVTYPGRAMRGSWGAKASGAPPAELLEPLVERAFGNVAADLHWEAPAP